MGFPNFHKEKFLNMRNIFLFRKTYKINENSIFLKMFIVFHDLSLFISVRAFLPSLRVLKMSQVREEIIRTVSVIREI